LPSLSEKPRRLEKEKTLVLPRIVKRRQKMSDEEVERVRERVLKMQRARYGPKGCSKSTQLDKVLLKKRFSHMLMMMDEGKAVGLKELEVDGEAGEQFVPQIFASHHHFMR
jgi:acyl-CoA reductase-like NAD-dependent aldehyde dehydrogenase